MKKIFSAMMILFIIFLLTGCGNDDTKSSENIQSEEVADGLLPIVEKFSGKYDRNTVAHKVTIINDTSFPHNDAVVNHPLYSDDWYDEGDINKVHIIGKSQLFSMDEKFQVSGNSTMYLMKNRFQTKTNGNTHQLL